MLDGKTVIPRAHDPEHEAARLLRDHGYTGPMETARENGMVGMRHPDLVKTAEWSISDRAEGGFDLRRFRPWSESGKARQATTVRRRTPASAFPGT